MRNLRKPITTEKRDAENHSRGYTERVEKEAKDREAATGRKMKENDENN